MKIGLYGGSFDPITTGHIQVAKECLNVVDEVWILPCHSSNYNKNMVSGEQRMLMINLAINSLMLDQTHNENNDRIKLCDYEIKNKISGGTKIFLQNFLNDQNNDYAFYFILGMDGANKIRIWYDWQNLIGSIPFIIVSRPGYSRCNNEWYTKEPHILLNITSDDCSSTDVRNTVKINNKYPFIINNVWNYIKANNLYE